MILSFDFVIQIKKDFEKAFSSELKFHDGCGGQYFSLTETNDDIKKFIISYLDEQNLNAKFAQDDLSFTVAKK